MTASAAFHTPQAAKQAVFGLLGGGGVQKAAAAFGRPVVAFLGRWWLYVNRYRRRPCLGGGGLCGGTFPKHLTLRPFEHSPSRLLSFTLDGLAAAVTKYRDFLGGGFLSKGGFWYPSIAQAAAFGGFGLFGGVLVFCLGPFPCGGGLRLFGVQLSRYCGGLASPRPVTASALPRPVTASAAWCVRLGLGLVLGNKPPKNMIPPKRAL